MTVVGFVVVPCSAPWLAVWLHDITASDALFRMFLGMILSLGLVWFYLFAGAALGCLTAPSSFLCGPAGRKWMKLLGGTRNLPTHRVVCVLGALLGFGIMAGVAVLLIYMHPTIT